MMFAQVQSNFNSDNCLVGGATLDYGPFGFMERYDPKWCVHCVAVYLFNGLHWFVYNAGQCG